MQRAQKTYGEPKRYKESQKDIQRAKETYKVESQNFLDLVLV